MVDAGAIAQAGAATYDTSADIFMSAFQSLANKKMADRANAWSAKQAANRHQVEVADLKAAGINPALTATGGNGAPMPQVTVPEMVMPKLNMGEKFLQYYNTWKGIENSTADTKLKEVMSDKTKQEAVTEVSKQSLNSAMASRELSQQALNMKLSDKTLAEVSKMAAEQSYTSALEGKVKVDTSLGKYELEKQKKVKGLYEQPEGEALKYIDALQGKNPGAITTGLGYYFLRNLNKYLRSGSGRTFVKPKKSQGATGKW